MMLTNALEADGYRLLKDAYSGGGGFADGSYLVAHKREDEAKYRQRRLLAYYSNFMRPVVDALTNPIFSKPVVRDFSGAGEKLLSAFRDDVDGRGTPINTFMKRAARIARLYGAAFIVEDNYAAEQMPEDEESASKGRIFPYLYLVRPEQVTDYACDRSGALESISYKIATAYVKDSLADAEKEETWTWMRTGWRREDKDGKVREGKHALGEVPVVVLLSAAADEGDLLPTPPLLPIAKTNQTIYNLCSELREILRNQAFSVLRYPVSRDISQEILEKGLQLGTDNALPYPAEAGSGPDFIAPPSEPAVLLQNEIARLVEDIYRQANLTSVVGVQIKQSGVAKQWDFEQTNQALADMAESCEAAETKLFQLFGKWTNIEIAELKIKYARDFGIVDVEGELEKAQRMKDLAVGGAAVNREIDRKAAEVYFPDVDDARYKEIMAEIDAIAEAAVQEKAYGDA